MATQYFYLLLIPTSTNKPFIFTKSFQISYNDANDLATKQRNYLVEFLSFNNNPLNYNNQWSKGYNTLKDCNSARQTDIDTLSGKIVQQPNWP